MREDRITTLVPRVIKPSSRISNSASILTKEIKKGEKISERKK